MKISNNSEILSLKIIGNLFHYNYDVLQIKFWASVWRSGLTFQNYIQIKIWKDLNEIKYIFIFWILKFYFQIPNGAPVLPLKMLPWSSSTALLLSLESVHHNIWPSLVIIAIIIIAIIIITLVIISIIIIVTIILIIWDLTTYL